VQPFQFDLSTVPDDDLGRLGTWTVSRLREFPAFTLWLAKGPLGTEALRRQEGQPSPGEQSIALPPWSDEELADAVEGALALSLRVANVSLVTGQLLDWIAVHVNAAAANRLRARHDLQRAIREN
jgi:hypothetical protein